MEQEVGLLRERVSLLEAKLQELQDEIDKKVNNALRKFFEYRAREVIQKTAQCEEYLYQEYFSQFDKPNNINVGPSNSRKRRLTFTDLDSSSIHVTTKSNSLVHVPVPIPNCSHGISGRSATGTAPPNLELEVPVEYDGLEAYSNEDTNSNPLETLDQQTEGVGVGYQDGKDPEIATCGTTADADWNGQSLIVKTETNYDSPASILLTDEDFTEPEDDTVEPGAATITKRKIKRTRKANILSKQDKGLPYYIEARPNNGRRLLCDGYVYHWNYSSTLIAGGSLWRCKKRRCKGKGMSVENDPLFYPYKIGHTCSHINETEGDVACSSGYVRQKCL